MSTKPRKVYGVYHNGRHRWYVGEHDNLPCVGDKHEAVQFRSWLAALPVSLVCWVRNDEFNVTPRHFYI